MRNICFEKLYKICVGQTSTRSFPEKSKLSMSLNQWSKVFVKFVFNVYQVERYPNILKLSCIPLAFTSYKACLQNKERSRTSLPASFSA